MNFPTTRTVYRNIIENKRLTQRARLAALTAMRDPSFSMLVRLIRDKETPSRLKILAARRYEDLVLNRDVDRVLNE